MKIIHIIIFVASLIPKGIHSYLYCSMEKNELECLLMCKFNDTVSSHTNITQCEPNEINMSSCRLLDLDLIEEKKYKNVEVIRAENNFIREIYAHTFEGFILVEKLYLSKNMLMFIHPDAFSHIRNLKHLDLRKNYLLAFNLHLKEYANNLELTLLIGYNNDITNYTTGDYHNNHYFVKQNDILEFKIKDPSTTLRNLINNLKLYELDIAYNNLLFLLEDTFKDQKNLSIINMAGNELTHLPNGLFEKVTKLKHINMLNNYIITLPPEIFIGNKRILTINLEHNRLEFLHKKTFFKLKKMYYLNLKSNNLVSIDKNLLIANRQLNFLDMSLNYIYNMSDNVFESNSNLETLILDENYFVSAKNRYFKNLVNVSQISFKNGQIKYLGKRLFTDNTKLQWIDLSNNRLKTASKDIFDRPNSINGISLSNNNIEQILNSFFEKLSNVTHIRLDRNQIKNINHMFWTNSELVNLNVSHNMIKRISSLPFKNKVNLKYIDLSYNLIFELAEDTFSTVINLQTLNLASNMLTTLPDLTNNFHLLALDLSNNQLKYISSEVYKNKKLLLSLFISDNMIRQLPMEIFEEAPNLKRLNFNKNNIQSLPAFDQATKLQEIMASCNNITEINNNNFTSAMTNNTKFYLHGNPINCKYLNLKLDIHKERFLDGTMPYCIMPHIQKNNLTAELLDKYQQRMNLSTNVCDSTMWDKYDFGIHICKMFCY